MSSQAAKQTQQAGQMPGIHLLGTTLTVIDLLYVGMLLFLLYQVFRGIKIEKKLQQPKYSYATRPKSINLVLMGIIILFGILTMTWQGEYVRGLIMVLLGITFYFSSRNRVIVSPEGLFADNKYITWNEMRKWAWDTKTGNLVIITKERGKTETRQVLQIGRLHMTEINERIRVFKLGKESAWLEEKEALDRKKNKKTEDGHKSKESGENEALSAEDKKEAPEK